MASITVRLPDDNGSRLKTLDAHLAKKPAV
jgi:hypothetical protein